MSMLCDQNAIVVAPATWYNRIPAKVPALQTDTAAAEYCLTVGARVRAPAAATIAALCSMLRNPDVDCEAFGDWER
jgi:hypothetical protein